MSRVSVAERVAAGMAFLDTRQPGWHKRIRVGELDISSDCGCVLGQLYGSFSETVANLDLTVHEMRQLGFYEYDGQQQGERYRRLTAAWEDEILARFEPIEYPAVA